MPALANVSDTFDPAAWREVDPAELGRERLTDVTYHRCVLPGPVAGRCGSPSTGPRYATPSARTRSTSCTPSSTTPAGRPDVGCVLLTGNGPSARDGGWAFCSGGDQRIRGRTGYQYADGETADTVDARRTAAEGGRLHVLEVQRLIRTMPKVVVGVVGGWAAGGGHSLHVVCDLTVASREHARFKQTDADVGSFDAGYGSAYLAKMVGQKNAREIFFLGRTYDAEQMQRMGAVNVVAATPTSRPRRCRWRARSTGSRRPPSGC